MVRARQRTAAVDDRTQHPADNGAQGFLHDLVVRDQAVGRVNGHDGRIGDEPSGLGQAFPATACVFDRGKAGADQAGNDRCLSPAPRGL
jgi:hypothetical protein